MLLPILNETHTFHRNSLRSKNQKYQRNCPFLHRTFRCIVYCTRLCYLFFVLNAGSFMVLFLMCRFIKSLLITVFFSLFLNELKLFSFAVIIIILIPVQNIKQKIKKNVTMNVNCELNIYMNFSRLMYIVHTNTFIAENEV